MKKNWVYYMQEGLRNMFRKKPKKKIKHEKLYRKDHKYDYLIVINYNNMEIKYVILGRHKR